MESELNTHLRRTIAGEGDGRRKNKAFLWVARTFFFFPFCMAMGSKETSSGRPSLGPRFRALVLACELKDWTWKLAE